MARLIFLDDDDIRHELFGEWAQDEGNEVFHAHSIDEFRKALNEQVFDEAHLDHDLNDFQYNSRSYHIDEIHNPTNRYWPKMTGRDACRLIVALPPEKRPKKINIHSWNEVGARIMSDILILGGYTKNEVTIQEFDEWAFWCRLLMWQEQGKQHAYMKWLDTESIQKKINAGLYSNRAAKIVDNQLTLTPEAGNEESEGEACEGEEVA